MELVNIPVPADKLLEVYALIGTLASPPSNPTLPQKSIVTPASTEEEPAPQKTQTEGTTKAQKPKRTKPGDPNSPRPRVPPLSMLKAKAAVKRLGIFSQKQLMAELSCSWGHVGNVVHQLAQEGWIKKGERKQLTSGSPAITQLWQYVPMPEARNPEITGTTQTARSSSPVAGTGKASRGSTNKDINFLVSKARSQGWTITSAGNGHLLLKDPTGTKTVVASSSPSDVNAPNQLRRELSAHGVAV